MARKLLFILSFFWVLQINAQDPDLFQTWYLYQMEFESGDIVIIDGWQPYAGNPTIPQISPSISIENTLEFNGFGICNTFEGVFEAPDADCFPTILTLSQTTNGCGLYEDMLEGDFIGFFAPDFASACFTITSEGDGFQTLILDGSIFSTYTFRNTPLLSSDDFTQSEISMYPNPASDKLFISSQTSVGIQKVSIYSLEGKMIVQKDHNLDYIDISLLSAGIYFLEIGFENGKLNTRKFIKK